LKEKEMKIIDFKNVKNPSIAGFKFPALVSVGADETSYTGNQRGSVITIGAKPEPVIRL
jgi:hypothetical protein